MIETALFGGSFNPPHLGHLEVLRHLTNALGFEQVWMIPTYHHPFGKPLAPFEDRVSLCRILAVELGGRVSVSEIERDIGGDCRTIDVVRALTRRHPKSRFRLVLGSDILSEVDRWKSFDELERLAPIVWVPRTGWDEENRRLGANAFLREVSSTEARERAAQGLPLDDLLPRDVARYIEEKGLYRNR